MSTRNLKHNILYLLPHKITHSFIYFRQKKIKINWKNPTLYDEKIQWLMVYMYDSTYGKYADKYQVREYVRECGLGKLLIPLIDVYDDAQDIDYDRLPDKFILKATHGSGKEFYEICTKKENLDIAVVNKKMNMALKEEFCKYNIEYQYEKIKPQIVCEELLEDNEMQRLDDYKVVCANGKAVAILVCTNRDRGRDYYSLDWKQLDYVKEQYRSNCIKKRPQCLEEMIKAAEILATPFPLARIDFYVVHNKLYFGEITLTPSAGIHEYLNEKGQKELGIAVLLP